MRGLIFLFAVAGIFSLALFIPQFRDRIILLAEFCLGRQLTGSVWHERMFNWEVYFLFFDLFICFIIYFSFLRFNKLAFSKGASWAAKILFFAALVFCQPIVCVSLKIKLIFCAIPVLEMLAFLCFVSYDEKERIQKHIVSPISNVWRALATKRTLCFFAFFALFPTRRRAASSCISIPDFPPAVNSPPPRLPQKMQPRVPRVPSRLGQVIPASRASL